MSPEAAEISLKPKAYSPRPFCWLASPIYLKQYYRMSDKTKHANAKNDIGHPAPPTKNAAKTIGFQMKMKIAEQCMRRYHNALKKLAE